MKKIEDFLAERERLSKKLLDRDNLVLKRFINLDSNTYKEGELSVKVKELMGLLASLVLRCDDCVLYHLLQCRKLGVTDGELEETVSVALVVGGSITIPHIRKLFEYWEEAKEEDLCHE